MALLIRRIRARCNHELVCIGTSATMISVGSVSSRRDQVAKVATTLFGRSFSPEQVVNETLARSLSFSGVLPTGAELTTAIETGVNLDDDLDQLKIHPVAIWLENRVALEECESHLVRRKPQRISEIVTALSKESGLEETTCRQFLADLLQWISVVNKQLQDIGRRYTILPFKLHQFISQTGSVYTTLDQDDGRYITLEPGIYKQDEETKTPIFPNVFSRATGQAFICVSHIGNRLEPREFREVSEEDEEATSGYLIIGEDIWDPLEDLELLPDSWLRMTKQGPVPNSKKRAFFPTRLYFDESGKCSETEPLKWWGWFMKAPLIFDPTGGVFFDTKTSEGTKLTKLGSEGRSTSTTITAFSILNRLNDAGYTPKDQKLLSFTDNRQDAALQAGHFNDFVQVIRLRAGIHVKLWTSNQADALHIEPIPALGLKAEGVITLQHALKRAIESVFQVEPNEIGVVAVGDPEVPNILLYEASEGSLGILSQFVEGVEIFHKVIEQAIAVCRYDDENYKGPAGYDDLLSYYNQRDHKIIDRHLIKDALGKLRICNIEIQTNPGFGSYEDQYQTMLRGLDPNSSTERKFLDFLYQNGLRLPDAAQKRVEGLYVQPDFYYEPRIWIFCDGNPHDDPVVQADDEAKRQAIIARGDEVWVFYYRDNLAEKVAARPDIFRKVR